jgi:lipopolysaccharide exporter
LNKLRALIRTKLKSYLKSDFNKNIFTLISGTGIAQGLTLLLSPVLTRLFTPEEFATFGLYTSVFTILSVIATGRYEIAIVIPDSDKEAKQLLGISVSISAILFLLLTILIIPFNSSFTKVLKAPQISTWLYFLPFSIFLIGSYRALNYWFNRKKKYSTMSKCLVYKNIGLNSSNIGAGLLHYGSGGLVVSSLISQLIGTFYLIIKYIKENNFNLKNITNYFPIWKKTAIKYKSFPLNSTWSALMNIASLQIPIILLTQFFSGDIVGWFFQAFKVLTMPLTLIGNSVGQVFFQKSSELKSQPIRLAEHIEALYKKLFLLIFIPLGIILSFGDYLFGYIFSQSWLHSGTIAMILVPEILIRFIVFPFLYIFELFQKQRHFLLFNSVLFFLRLISFIIGYYIFDNAYWAIVLYSISGFISYSLMANYVLKQGKVDRTKILKYTLKLLVPVWGLLILIRFIILH